mmetsp:Transcript_5499/g.15313  ORF Transcript_5499/g.15313 Transcript_5499/m.15313 type:complete len:234 (+) Transcript_5499:431-1132(+)
MPRLNSCTRCSSPLSLPPFAAPALAFPPCLLWLLSVVLPGPAALLGLLLTEGAPPDGRRAFSGVVAGVAFFTLSAAAAAAVWDGPLPAVTAGPFLPPAGETPPPVDDVRRAAAEGAGAATAAVFAAPLVVGVLCRRLLVLAGTGLAFAGGLAAAGEPASCCCCRALLPFAGLPAGAVVPFAARLPWYEGSTQFFCHPSVGENSSSSLLPSLPLSFSSEIPPSSCSCAPPNSAR